MKLKQLKQKKCRYCKELFSPRNSTMIVCGFECAVKYSTKKREAKEHQEYKKAKVKLKTKAQWLKEAQIVFNKWIRLRDEQEPCISCRRHHEGQYHAGHYRTVGSSPELRFNELNCHKQCSVCNNHLSGNIIKYRQSLINKIGLQQVEWLEGKHEPLHLTIDEIVEIKKKYSDKIKFHSSEV